MKYRDIIKLLEADGWYRQRQEGSHIVFYHPTKKPGVVIVAAGGKLNRDVPAGTLGKIRRDAGLK